MKERNGRVSKTDYQGNEKVGVDDIRGMFEVGTTRFGGVGLRGKAAVEMVETKLVKNELTWERNRLK